ncbi:MAG: long-chain fatty acid--CoA ligase [gamma proteobacterium endosymbiont of Lamellibrachia anaximandri]|nr:long-chain fatty acid--CoA ligase [gamma proteobacterium endosymbiont of Lamellibrachia anaximandri]MBL3532556.1 long-chain fatty acid--CoA ligase [gamma proteobacterium endosymbiont of Lamellibrachia anaximandri]
MDEMREQKTDYILLKEADTLGALFQERIRRTPDTVAYTQFDPASESWQDMTWREMGGEVARWQAALQQEDLQPGERVALMLRNCREWVMFDLAAQGLGLVTVPIYTNDRPENIGYILQDAGVRLLLLEGDEQWQNLQQIRHQLAGLNRILTIEPVDPMGLQPRLASLADWLPAEAGGYEAADIASDALASLVYTSGTTGRSKGVMLSHSNILWNIEAGLKLITIYPSDRFLSFLPLSHTLERTVGYYMPIAVGANVAYARSIPQLGEDLMELKPTIMISVPRIFERVYAKIQAKLADDSAVARKLFNAAIETGWLRFEHDQGRAPWSAKLALWPLYNKLVASKIQAKLGGRLRIAVSGGAALTPEIAKLFIGLGVPILQGYGLTETSPIITANPLEDNVPASVGRVLPGIETKIGENDELLSRSPSVMLGYWNNPEATSDVVDSEGWLHTGDKVRIENEHIFITGRLKEIIVLANGEKVPPADMEMCIDLDALFEQAMVIGEGKPFLTALIVLNKEACKAESIDPTDSSEQQLELLTARVASHLGSFPGYARIRRIALVQEPWTPENGLITPTLKLRRSRILEQHSAEVETLYSGH